MRKFSMLRIDCAPKYLSAGTCTTPMLSVSSRKAPASAVAPAPAPCPAPDEAIAYEIGEMYVLRADSSRRAGKAVRSYISIYGMSCQINLNQTKSFEIRARLSRTSAIRRCGCVCWANQLGEACQHWLLGVHECIATASLRLTALASTPRPDAHGCGAACKPCPHALRSYTQRIQQPWTPKQSAR